jgi:glycerate 2-kinase
VGVAPSVRAAQDEAERYGPPATVEALRLLAGTQSATPAAAPAAARG